MPGRVAAAARAGGRPVFIVGLEGFAQLPALQPFPHLLVRLGAVGQILAAFREHGCTELVLIGGVQRPSLLDLRPDAEGVRVLARIGRAAFGGDDSLLRAVVRILHEEGFHVTGAQDVIADVLAPEGVLTRVAPDSQALSDVAQGMAIARALGAADVGQGVVVQQGMVLAVEAIEGTDAMLDRCAGLARSGPGGVLVKVVKPGQDRRADLPTVGPETIRRAHAARVRGIAYEANGTLMAGRNECVATADATGLFLLGFPPDSGARSRNTPGGPS